MKKLFFVRHGERSKNIKKIALSKLGKKQSIKTGKYLSGVKVDIIYSSSALRAKETSYNIAKYTNVPVLIKHALRERPRKTKTSKNEVEDIFSKVTGFRMKRLITLLLNTNYKNIVLVTHGGAIADFLKIVFKTKYLDTKIPSFSFLGKYSIPECSITIVGHSKGKYYLLQTPSQNHLGRKN